MVLGIAALSALSISAHAGNKGHDATHSDKRSFYNDRGHRNHDRRQHRHNDRHSRYGRHHRSHRHYNRHDYGHNRYSRNYYGHSQYRHNHRHHGRHGRKDRRHHTNYLIPRVSGQLHLPGIRLNLHL